MKRGLVVSFLALLIALTVVSCGGASGTEGETGTAGEAGDGGTQGSSGSSESGGKQFPAGDFGYILNDTKDGIIITYYTGSSFDVVFPDTIEDYPVVGFLSFFSGNKKLTSVSLPDTITAIPNTAFYNCEALAKVKLPASLVSIGNSAFNSTALTSVELPLALTTIGSYAFGSCSSLKSISLPETLTTVREGGFYHCRNLSSFNVPAALTQYGYNVFSDCHKLPLAVRDQLTAQGYSASQF
ncbi:MAG: leucine-rich repeat domain-containing protein [Treponema sp.]|jgi:hypothetical protein|nr:leucine-rich repeat domain-containing protein [Treponema sp.]